jgi:hypothetical protein
LSSIEIEQLYQDGIGPKAYDPSPADGASDIDPNTILSWWAGKDALTHDVYLGTDFVDINDANTSSPEYKGNQSATSYDPCGLNLDTTYFWRIDELNASGTVKGDIWSFTTWSGIFDPNLNLVSWWKLDDGSGSTASDSAGSNDGTVYGAAWTTGQINGALDFDGTNDYVVIADAPFDFGSDTDFSICVWIKTSNTLRQRIVDKIQANTPPYQGYELLMNTNGLARVNVDDGPNFTGSYTTTIVNDGNWHFLTAVADRDGNIEIYCDGSPEDSDPMSAIGNIDNNISLAFGRSMDYNGQYFDGKIDDVRIYDRALTPLEVLQLYNAGL